MNSTYTKDLLGEMSHVSICYSSQNFMVCGTGTLNISWSVQVRTTKNDTARNIQYDCTVNVSYVREPSLSGSGLC